MTDFWSKRRAAVEAENDAELLEVDAEQRAQADAEIREKSDAELLTELGLPEPESLMLGDDFKPYLSDVVPARLRTRALRVLWRLNPTLANLDGLVDYGEDFTDAATVMENLQTTYQVGKGMLAHVQEMMRQAEEETDDLPAASGDDPDEDAAEDIAALSDEADAPDSAPALPVSEVEDSESPAELSAVVSFRRMQFSFEDHQSG